MKGPVSPSEPMLPIRPKLWSRWASNRLALTGGFVTLFIMAAAALTPLLGLPDPNAIHPAARLLPIFSRQAILGTDQLGRDLLSRLLWGSGLSLCVGMAATLSACVIGSAIGLIAAYTGGFVDSILMRLIDMIMAFPYLLLALAIVAVLGPGLFNALLAIGIVNIPFFARTIRGVALSLVERPFMAAAGLSGASHVRIVLRELLPNVLPVIIVTMSTTLGWMILETAGLSFLGLGAQPPQADLGSLLGDARQLVLLAPHLALVPGLLIMSLVVGINLAGDGLRDVLDPRLQGGLLETPSPNTRVERAPLLEAGPSSPSIMSVRGLTVQHRLAGDGLGRTIVDHVDLDIAPGKAIGLVGESGSGKSVLALTLLGLAPSPPMQIVDGSITLGTQNLLAQSLKSWQDLRGRRVAIVFQDPLTTLNPLMPVGAQIAEVIARHLPGPRSERQSGVLALIDRVGLPNPEATARAYPHQLSGGQRQRIGIAMALAAQPDILIADEPTTALDVSTKVKILDLLSELRHDQGLSIILISHDFSVIQRVCDHVLIMYRGQIVEEGPTSEIMVTPTHPYTQQLLDAVPVLGRPEKLFTTQG
ncbi:peptide/nickel transport system permease protein [Arboricoccus pini]|uniref:Peptide/nickel transport system permease protein n=1 Tax=Arboricoccus pini TaxID=1963835 RepID=A0A212R7W2_9PROT|nr:dipeptide/oligopeptide/nickel ABC transporter permease/ATP-binding protein [Arboricoccus pini]SNB68281.1 peptide/nickel transport system permease protein [Arboricoccus pini]